MIIGQDPAAYGNAWAAIYDEHHATRPDISDPSPAVDFLVALAGSGPVLELGIGTGRVALPLAARGIEVHGVEASEAMVSVLRAKPGGRDIPVRLGDLADVDVPDTYRLVFAVFNALFALPDGNAQSRCFANVSTHLAATGAFVVEAFVPNRLFSRTERKPSSRESDSFGADLPVAYHDSSHQRIEWQESVFVGGRRTVLPVSHRYARPAELDRMAQSAGLHLAQRWGGWSGEVFDAWSRVHVSVYVRASDA